MKSLNKLLIEQRSLNPIINEVYMYCNKQSKNWGEFEMS